MLESHITWTDTLISRVGGASRYQLLLFINFSIKWMLAGMILFSLNFFYITPDFTCTKQQLIINPNCQQFVCSHKQNQQFWFAHLQQPIPSSISLDYGIIMLCDKKWISSVIQSFSYIGAFIGYLLMSYLADNFGRRPIQLISWLINIVGLIMLVSSGSLLPVVAIGGFFMGLGANATITLHYTFLKQFIIGSYRQRSIIALQIMFSIGISIVALLSMFIMNWKLIALFFMLIPALACIPFSLWIIEQTPNFILIKQGRQSLLKSLNKIGTINGNQQPLQNQDLQVIQDDNEEYINRNQTSKHKYSVMTLFKYPSLRKITLICGVIDLSIQFLYDGTILSLDKIGVNVYWDQILVGFVQIFAAVFCSWAITRLERRKFTKYALTLCGILTLSIGVLTLFFNHQENQLNFHTITEMLILALLRFTLNSVWGLFFVYVAELFPKSVTSISFGYISAIGTIGASAAPYVRLFTARMSMFVMSLLCFLTAFIVLQLRQTKGQTVRQDIQQIQVMNQDKKKSTVSGNSQDN